MRFKALHGYARPVLFLILAGSLMGGECFSYDETGRLVFGPFAQPGLAPLPPGSPVPPTEPFPPVVGPPVVEPGPVPPVVPDPIPPDPFPPVPPDPIPPPTPF